MRIPEYLVFTALEFTSIRFEKHYLERLNDIESVKDDNILNMDDLFDTKIKGEHFHHPDNEYIIYLQKGSTLSLSGKSGYLSHRGVIYKFHIEGLVKISGKISSLITGNEYYFPYLFKGCDILNTPEFPKTVVQNGYKGTFEDCKYLLHANELPSTQLNPACYALMFKGCESLINPPKIKAKRLADECCLEMFSGCTSLLRAAEINSSIAYKNCFQSMYYGCSSLREASKLPMTALRVACFRNMYGDCSSLQIPPKLPAVNLAPNCYEGMFRGSGLVTAPELRSKDIRLKSYYYMFAGCGALETAPSELPGIHLSESCYEGMFEYCSVLETAPDLPAKKYVYDAYKDMFRGCVRLESKPKINVEKKILTYSGMFAETTIINN